MMCKLHMSFQVLMYLWQELDQINGQLKTFSWKKVRMKVTQSCLTVCNPMDYIVHGILQARVLQWVAFPISRGSSQPRDRTHVSYIVGRFFFLPVEPQGKPLSWKKLFHLETICREWLLERISNILHDRKILKNI